MLANSGQFQLVGVAVRLVVNAIPPVITEIFDGTHITDVNNHLITYLHYMLTELTNSPSMIIRAPGGSGRFIKADDNPMLRILGRRAGTTDAFVDLFTSPLELAWANPADVEIKTQANAITNLEQVVVHVRITKNP